MQSGEKEALARRAEASCLTGWPALRHVFYDGWLLRLAGGHTRRANSVNLLWPGTRDLKEKIQYCETVYARQALPTIFRIFSFTNAVIEDALDAERYRPAEDETRVIYMDDAALRAIDADVEVIVETSPSEEWLAAQARCNPQGAAAQAERRRILGMLAVPAGFAAARGADGSLASLAFGAVHDGLVCVNLVVTDPRLPAPGTVAPRRV